MTNLLYFRVKQFTCKGNSILCQFMGHARKKRTFTVFLFHLKLNIIVLFLKKMLILQKVKDY